jgi:hypothetical protein
MEDIQRTTPTPTQSSAADRVEALEQRGPLERLFESLLLDVQILTSRMALGTMSVPAYLSALQIAQKRLAYYAPGGELERDVTRLAAVLAGLDPSPGPDAGKQDFSAPESGSGTEVATSNSNSNSKRIRNPSVMFAI